MYYNYSFCRFLCHILRSIVSYPSSKAGFIGNISYRMIALLAFFVHDSNSPIGAAQDGSENTHSTNHSFYNPIERRQAISNKEHAVGVHTK